MSSSAPSPAIPIAECPWCGAVMSRGGTCLACVSGLDADEAPAQVAIEGLELLEQVGRGGMGVVFKARQRSLGRTVAVKLLAGGPLASDTFVARFKAEAAAAAGLQHPGIVAVHEVGEDETGTPWFSMDYIAGPNLAERLKDGPLEPREAARLIKLIADAIHYAHGRGLLHRDLKPSNILLDEFEQPRVTDFGIARRMDDDSTLTITGDILGSPAYMPPEQASGRSGEATAASDVYAMGAVLYEMLCGRPPFVAPSRAAMLNQVLHADPLPLRRLNAAIPAELETVCLKCLEKEPARRYATAAALAEEMARFLRGDPVLARPLSTTGHIWRWARRHKAASLAAASLFLGLAGVSSVLAVMNLRVSKARGEAEHNARNSEHHAAESRENLARSYLITANRHLEEVDYQRALLWLLQAWETTADPAERRLISMSLATTLRATPQLVKVWAPGGNGECAVFDPKAERIACASGAPEVFIWSADPKNNTTITLTHDGGSSHCSFNADGTRLFTQGASNVRLWDAATGQPLGKATPHMSGGDYLGTRRAATFSTDGRHLLTFTAEGAQLIDATNGEPSGPLLKGPEPVTAAALLPDAASCLLACGKRVLLVDSANGTQLSTWPLMESAGVLSLDARAERCVALCGAGTVTVFSLHHPTVPTVTFSSSGVNYQATFSPEGTEIVTTSFAGEARLFDSTTGVRVREFAHDAGVSRAAWYRGGVRALVTSSWDNTVRLWRHSTGQKLAVLHHGGRTMSVDAAAAPQRILTASADGSVRLYERAGDNAAGKMHARLRVSRTQPWATGVAWINDRMVKMCRPATGEGFGAAMLHQHSVVSAALAATAEHVATLTDDGTVHLWKAGGVLALPVATLPPSGAAVKSLAFSADGTRLTLLRADGSFSLYDGKGTVLCAQMRPPGGLRAWSVSQNDTLLAALGTDGKARAYRMTDGQPAGPFFGPERGAWSLTLSPDGDAVCLNEGPPNTLDVKRAVRLWNPQTGQPLTPPLEHYDDIGAVAFSPDGRLLATGSEDFQVIIWDRRTGQPAASSWQHSFWPKLLAFSPDSRVLAVAGHDASFAFLRSADCTQLGPRRQWQAPPQFITFNESGESLLALRADNPQDAKSPYAVYEMSLAPDNSTDAAVRDTATLASGMTLEKNGVVRMLTAKELVALWHRVYHEVAVEQ